MQSKKLPEAKTTIVSKSLRFGTVDIKQVLKEMKQEENEPKESLKQLEQAIKEGVFKDDSA